MRAYYSNEKSTARAFLVGLELKSGKGGANRETLEELAELARTAGAEVVGLGTQRLESPEPATFIGTGKAEEFAGISRASRADSIIFDDELSPAQTRNLEKIFECRVLDRTALILEIFSQRARTREGKLQVELAQLRYLLPRLTRFWGHLSRQRGSTGAMGGEGETQLEADRRRVRERIDKIGEDLKVVRRQRSTQRQGRQRNAWPLASIVGYTNAGKSTLLNALTGAGVLVEDKLFATLDPTTRRLRLPTNQNVLLSDTVGFIRKLPHGLVEAFKATLEEVVQADLLLHVVDSSHPQVDGQIAAVNEVLREIGAAEKPTLMVFNKVDRLTHRLPKLPNAIAISAKNGTGLPELMEELGAALRPVRESCVLSIPHTESAVIARVHAVGQVIECAYRAKTTRLKARIPPHHHAEFAAYILKPRAAKR